MDNKVVFTWSALIHLFPMGGFSIAFMCLPPNLIPSPLLEMTTSKGGSHAPSLGVTNLRHMDEAGVMSLIALD